MTAADFRDLGWLVPAAGSLERARALVWLWARTRRWGVA